MIRPRMMKHLVRALKKEGFYIKGDEPGELNFDVEAAIEVFLRSPRGKPVRRINNTFRTVASRTFSAIPRNCDVVSPMVRSCAKEFIKRNTTSMKAPKIKTISDFEAMATWEKGELSANARSF